MGNILNVGAIRAFESVHGMTMDGIAGNTFWSRLFTAVTKGQMNPNGYTYGLANQHYPISLTIWHNGKVVLKSAANTGIPASPPSTAPTPVYLKFFSYVKGSIRKARSTTTRCTTRPTSTVATRCTSSAGTATGPTRAWAASSCPSTRPRRRTRT